MPSSIILTFLVIILALIPAINEVIEKIKQGDETSTLKKWALLTPILIVILSCISYCSNQAEMETELENSRKEAEKKATVEQERFDSTSAGLRSTIQTLRSEAKADSIRFDVILSNFGKQISGILNTQDQIEELHHPLFPINLEYSIELDIRGMSATDIENKLNRPINTMFKILDTLTPAYKSEVMPPKFLIQRLNDGRPRIELKAFDPESLPQYKLSPFGYLYGDIIGNLLPEIFVIFSKSGEQANLDRYNCDLSLCLASLGYFYGKTEVSFKYYGRSKILITVKTTDIDYLHIDRGFHSIEGLSNGTLYTYYQPSGFPGVKSEFKNLKISFGNIKTDAFNIKYSEDDIHTLKVRNQPQEVYIKSGKEILTSPQYF